MGRVVDEDDKDRYLLERSGWWCHQRWVPTTYGEINPRRFSRVALKTRDRIEARAKRDEVEASDNARLAHMLTGTQSAGDAEAYKAMLARAVALGVTCVPRGQIADLEVGDLVDRLLKLTPDAPALDRCAVMGGDGPPPVTLHQALDIIEANVKREWLARKSPNQRAAWRKGRLRGLDSFVTVVGDTPINAITREQALQLHGFWLNRIAPESGTAEVGPNAGNKVFSALRATWADYHAYIGDEDRPNPFRKLRFDETGTGGGVPFSTPWLQDKILVAGALDGMNDEARCILLAMVNTGARPSEIANLRQDRIMLSHNIPHIDIRPTQGRAIETGSSRRRIPLMGVSLEAMRRHPQGFPRYHDKSSHLSNTLMKYLRGNGLLETPRHVVYSIRHSFEERMKRAGVDMELRQYLMGHTIDRPRYGYADDLTWELSAGEQVAL